MPVLHVRSRSLRPLRPRQSRRPQRSRRTVLAGPLVGLLAALIAGGLAGCGAAHGVRLASTRSHPVVTPATAMNPRAVAPDRRRRPAPDPGRLPQTRTLPSAVTRQFHAEMAAFWSGVVSGRLRMAMPSFFPETAYAQVKAIPDPAADWQNRLVDRFGLDIGAAHDLLGAHPATARLLAVNVPTDYAHWVPPGVCENGVGYWEVPNARVVYRQGGQVRSFGIASMISWRGVWYIVHLGAVLPTTSGGEVDAPAAGPGMSAYSGTC